MAQDEASEAGRKAGVVARMRTSWWWWAVAWIQQCFVMDESKESNIFNWLQKFHRCFGEPSEAKVRVQSLLRPSFDLGTKTCAFVTFHEF